MLFGIASLGLFLYAFRCYLFEGQKSQTLGFLFIIASFITLPVGFAVVKVCREKVWMLIQHIVNQDRVVSTTRANGHPQKAASTRRNFVSRTIVGDWLNLGQNIKYLLFC
jgi:uncharacterized membrane protein YccF (DUF307 family)